MSEVKHTPGPWTAVDCRIFGHANENGFRGMGLCVASASRYDNAQEPDYSTVAEAEANARLIAASPALLEVCQSISDAAGTSEGDLRTIPPRIRNLIPAVRAALALATNGGE